MFRLFSLSIIASVFVFANALDYNLIKKGKSLDDNNTLLIIGGIQGDEPGGFLAASLLATEYEITKGEIWVVPNLNFPSIIKRSRGVNGDMNRKFSDIKDSDPDYKAVKGIKDLITSPDVAMIINLHDGSGFYREKYIDKMLNPKRWGNSCIIDQKVVKDIKYGNLEDIAQKVATNINKHLFHPLHKYHIKNTKTKLGDVEMLKSLTYYAIANNKAAFANEASKTLDSTQRVYYHLLALEEYMRIANIEFKRNFTLNTEGIDAAINKEIELSMFDKKVFFSLRNPRPIIGYVPMPENDKISYEVSNPLTAVIKDGKGYKVHYGNRVLTKLVPQYFEYDKKEEIIKVEIDGDIKDIAFGSLVRVNEYFNVLPESKTRVNVIGYVNQKQKNESGLNIKKDEIIKKYSIDKKGKTFRVELYNVDGKQDSFKGMFLVEFAKLAEDKASLEVADTEKPEKLPLKAGK